MEKKQVLGLVGSIILFVGVFTPIISIPMAGDLNYFQNGKGDGVIVLVLSVISFILTLARKYRGLWFTGLACLGVTIFTFVNFQIKISEAKDQMQTQLSDNPFRGLTGTAIQSIQIQWGWAMLIVGAGLLIAAAAIKESLSYIPEQGIKREAKKCPYCAEMILIEARVCRYCGRELEPIKTKQEQKPSTSTRCKTCGGPLFDDGFCVKCKVHRSLK